MAVFFALVALVLLLAQPSASDIAAETVRQQERRDFQRSHAWVACPPMSKRAVDEKPQSIKIGAGEYFAIMASTTYGFGFNAKKEDVPTTTAALKERCEQEYLEDGEQIV